MSSSEETESVSPDPWSVRVGSTGVLVLHGFTGSPASVRPLAKAFVEAGFSIEMPLLAGHGTSPEDLAKTTFGDWFDDATNALNLLTADCEKVFVAGLSMGGTLTLRLAELNPQVAGIITINALVDPAPQELVDTVLALVEAGAEMFDSIGNDIAKPGADEYSYDKTPLAPLLSLGEATEAVSAELSNIKCPVLIVVSPQDHVVLPSNSETIAAKVSGPVERLTCERSYHVATLDFDAELIEATSVAFIKRVAGL